jgi:hypothetical protein
VGRGHGPGSYESFTKVVGDRLRSILHHDLEQAIREVLPDSVEVLYSTTISSITDNSAAATMAGGKVDVKLPDGRAGCIAGHGRCLCARRRAGKT